MVGRRDDGMCMMARRLAHARIAFVPVVVHLGSFEPAGADSNRSTRRHVGLTLVCSARAPCISHLILEFLTGDEYVVDGVSRDGGHKIVALWKVRAPRDDVSYKDWAS